MKCTSARWNALGALALVCGIVGCESPGKNTVEAKLFIVKKWPGNLWNQSENSAQYQEDYVATHAAIIKSPTIVQRALKQSSLKGLKIAEGEDAPWRLIEALDVRREADLKTPIVTITLKCDDEAEGIKALSAIIKSYQEFLDETYKSTSDATLDLIQKARQTLKDHLEHAQQELQGFRAKSPFLLMKDESGSNIYAARVRALDAKQTELKVKQLELAGRLARATAAKSEKSVAIQVKANEWAAKSGFDKLPAEVRQGKDALAAYLDYLKEELQELNAIQVSISEQTEVEQKRVRELANYEAVDERLRRDVQASQALFDSIVKRMNELGLTKDFGGYEARLMSLPRAVKGK